MGKFLRKLLWGSKIHKETEGISMENSNKALSKRNGVVNRLGGAESSYVSV